MIHAESAIVKSDDVRPGITDRKDRCGYCRGLLGESHDPGCVCRTRTVMVRMHLDYIIEVPESWDVDRIEFHRNESSWCATNALEEIEALSGRLECLCPRVNYTFLREATPEDEAEEEFRPQEPESNEVRWIGSDGKEHSWLAQRLPA